MPDNKLTEEEVIIAFKHCCATEECDNCIAIKKIGNKYDCVLEPSDIVTAFNRLQAEKENLEIELKAMRGAANGFKADNERLQTECGKGANALIKLMIENRTAKAEAYKEFADRLKEKSWDVPYETKNAHFVQVIDVGDIDNLLKELVGEDK